MRKSASVLTLVAALLLLVAAGASAQHPTPGSEHGAAAQAHSQPAEAGHGGPAQGDAAAGGIESEQEEQHFELPNFMLYIYEFNHEKIDAWLAGINQGLPPLLHLEWVNIENLTYCLIVIIILSTFAITASRKRKLRPESRQYLFMENLLMGLYDFFAQVLGKDTRKYIPLVGTLFIYILCMNLFGLIPLMKSPTSVWGVNAAMAICVFFYVQWTAIVRNGFLGYLRHFVGEPWWMFPLQFPLHILEELIKPVSLSLRLFGNILGEDTLLAVFAGLVVLIPGVLKLPLHFPFMLLALIFSTVQALIFSMLTAIYIALMLPHEEHGH
jgi:F-type H+-transporting ATPase subunit a